MSTKNVFSISVASTYSMNLNPAKVQNAIVCIPGWPDASLITRGLYMFFSSATKLLALLGGHFNRVAPQCLSLFRVYWIIGSSQIHFMVNFGA